MRKKPKLLFKYLALFVITGLTVLSLVQCPSGGTEKSTPPLFIGTWKEPLFDSTFILTLTETTFTIFTDNATGSAFITGGISFDDVSKHILALVVTESHAGIAPMAVPGDSLYITYWVAGDGSLLEMNWSKTHYIPLDPTNTMYLLPG